MTNHATSVLVGLMLAGTAGYAAIGWPSPTPQPKLVCEKIIYKVTDQTGHYEWWACESRQATGATSVSPWQIGGWTDPRIATTDRSEICGFVDGLSYSRRHRALLTEEDRKEDFARAGVPWSQHRSYELDHTLSLSLGGADVPANRNPQPCSKWEGYRCVAGEAAIKDRLELLLWRKVCKESTMPLAEAQSLLLGNWRAAYRQQFGEEP